MMSMSLCLVLMTAICQCVEYKNWVQLIPKDPVKDYVMFECKKLNEDYKDEISRYFPHKWPHKGIHVSVWVPPKLQQERKVRVATDPGCNIHASYNRDEGKRRPLSKARWGMENGHWIGFEEKLHKNWLKKETEPLKVAYDNFAKYKPELFLKPEECRSNKRKDLPDPKYTREWTMQQEIKGAFLADEQYHNYYPLNNYRTASVSSSSSSPDGYNYNDKHKSSRVYANPNNQYHDEDYRKESINTDSESINIPTFIVTLISCMFLFVIFMLYTGCIGLIAGGIGYKMKDSRQTTKDHTFDEI